jgi:hypothetical protein
MSKKCLAIWTLALCALAGRVEAANYAVITSPQTLLNFVILAFAVAGVSGSVKVLTLVRGGQLSKGWQYFVAGFVVLGLCQLAILGGAFEVITLPSYVVPACLTVMTGLFFFGIIETKRALS